MKVHWIKELYPEQILQHVVTIRRISFTTPQEERTRLGGGIAEAAEGR